MILRIYSNGNEKMWNDEIRAKGAWICANIGPFGDWSVNTGVTAERVDIDNIDWGQRKFNRSIFGNVFYSINSCTKIAFELSHWLTKYRVLGGADNWRGQLAFILNF